MKLTAAQERAGVLFDMLVERDLDSRAIMARTGWTHAQFLKAAQALRDIFSDNDDTITLVCEPRGQREAWLYGLRAGMKVMSAEQSRWIPNRLQDGERRLKTIVHVLDVAERSLDGRTVLGRKSRIYGLHLHRALEEVEMLGLDEGGAGGEVVNS